MITPPTKEGFKTPLPNGILPFPIHSRLGIDREMWSFGACPNAQKLLGKTIADYSEKLSKSETFTNMFDDALTRLKNKDFEKNLPLLTRCFEASDFFIMDNKNSNDPILSDDPEKYPNADVFKRCYDMYIIGVYTNMELAKITVSPILNQIKKYFSEKVDKTSKTPLKYVQYSGHDDTIAAHLRTYGMVDPDCNLEILTSGVDKPACKHHPFTSSNLIWELIDGINETKEFGVKVSYNGDYIDYCTTGEKDNFGDFFCTLDQFNKKIENDYTKDWNGWCDIPSNDPKSGSTLVYVLLAVVSVLLIAVIYLGIKVATLNREKNVRILKKFKETNLK
jgi:hypothetical protein